MRTIETAEETSSLEDVKSLIEKALEQPNLKFVTVWVRTSPSSTFPGFARSDQAKYEVKIQTQER